MNIQDRLSQLEEKYKPADLVTVLYSDNSTRKMIFQDAIVEILRGVSIGLYDDDPEPYDEDGTSQATQPVYEATSTEETPRAIDILNRKSNLVDALLGRAKGVMT